MGNRVKKKTVEYVNREKLKGEVIIENGGRVIIRGRAVIDTDDDGFGKMEIKGKIEKERENVDKFETKYEMNNGMVVNMFNNSSQKSPEEAFEEFLLNKANNY